MRLTELFDKPLAFTWDTKSSKHWHAMGEVDGKSYSISMYIQDGFETPSGDPITDLWCMGFTPTENGLSGTYLEPINGNEIKLFSAVVTMTKEFVTTVQPTTILFSAHKEVENRIRLYRKLVNKFEPLWTKYGYTEVPLPNFPSVNLNRDYDHICMTRSTNQ